MHNRYLARGLFLAAIALTFGLNALRYSIGSFQRAGPGLFPLMVSVLLLVLAVATLVQARLRAPEPVRWRLRNIGLMVGALCAFALMTRLVNMTAGIVAMVFIASLAASTRSSWRSVKIAAGLLAVAFAFKQLLGLSLPLI